MPPFKRSKFEDPTLVAETVCNTLIRYAIVMRVAFGQDAIDALAMVREEVIKPARERGLSEADIEAVEQLLLTATETASRAARGARKH